MSKLSHREQFDRLIPEIAQGLDHIQLQCSEAYGLAVLCGLQPAAVNRLQTKMRAIGYLREQISEMAEMARSGPDAAQGEG